MNLSKEHFLTNPAFISIELSRIKEKLQFHYAKIGFEPKKLFNSTSVLLDNTEVKDNLIAFYHISFVYIVKLLMRDKTITDTDFNDVLNDYFKYLIHTNTLTEIFFDKVTFSTYNKEGKTIVKIMDSKNETQTEYYLN